MKLLDILKGLGIDVEKDVEPTKELSTPTEDNPKPTEPTEKDVEPPKPTEDNPKPTEPTEKEIELLREISELKKANSMLTLQQPITQDDELSVFHGFSKYDR